MRLTARKREVSECTRLLLLPRAREAAAPTTNISAASLRLFFHLTRRFYFG